MEEGYCEGSVQHTYAPFLRRWICIHGLAIPHRYLGIKSLLLSRADKDDSKNKVTGSASTTDDKGGVCSYNLTGSIMLH